MTEDLKLSAHQIVIHVLMAFAEKSKPLSDEEFIEACNAIAASFTQMGTECRNKKLTDS